MNLKQGLEQSFIDRSLVRHVLILSIETLYFIFKCNCARLHGVSFINDRQLVGNFEHLHARLGPYDLDHTIFDESRRDEDLQDMWTAINQLIADGSSHEAKQVAASNIAHTQCQSFFTSVYVTLGLICISGRCWHISRRIQTHTILFIKGLVDLWNPDILIVLLQNISIFRREIPRLRITLPQDDCVRQIEGESRWSSSTLGPQLIAEPFKFGLE